MKIIWHRTNNKSVRIGNYHAVLTKCAVNDEQISTFISAAYDPHMFIAGIEHQITRLSLIPRDGGTVGVLHVSAAAVAAARKMAVAATTMMLRETEPMAQGIFRR